MYTPSHFLEANDERIATLISKSTDGLQVTHAPIQFDRKPGERGALIGHVARANPHARLLIDDADVLVIFQGPHAYVSPAWYLDQDPNDPNVPTWNYVIVHVYGHICPIDDAAQKWNIATDLAAKYEQGAQNRSLADQENVIKKFESGTDPHGHAIARLMRENIGTVRRLESAEP